MSVQAAESLTSEQIKARKERRKLLIEELNRFGVTWDRDRPVKDMNLQELERLYIRERIYHAKIFTRRMREEEELGY
jgi:ribosome-interacting GTPase 1